MVPVVQAPSGDLIYIFTTDQAEQIVLTLSVSSTDPEDVDSIRDVVVGIVRDYDDQNAEWYSTGWDHGWGDVGLQVRAPYSNLLSRYPGSDWDYSLLKPDDPDFDIGSH